MQVQGMVAECESVDFFMADVHAHLHLPVAVLVLRWAELD